MINPQIAQQQLARTLEQLINSEIEIYRAYLKVIEEERALVVKSQTSDLAHFTETRERLMEAMSTAQEQRFTLMRQVLGEPEMQGRRKAPPPSLTLSQFVRKYCAPAQSKLLAPKVDQLRKLVAQSHGKSVEFSQILDFSLKMVGGLASILWSATKSVVQSYSSNAVIKESVHDPRSRKSGTLREA